MAQLAGLDGATASKNTPHNCKLCKLKARLRRKSGMPQTASATESNVPFAVRIYARPGIRTVSGVSPTTT